MLGKIALSLLFAGVTASVLVMGTYSTSAPSNAAPEIVHVPLPIPDVALTTDTWGLFNPETGEILAGNNIQTERPIASVTKLFTAYVVLESKKQDEVVTVSWADLNTEGRAGKLEYGKQMTLQELLFPLLIESSNDAGEAIRRSLGNDFSNTVTTLTTELSLEHTHITDATGLSSQDVSAITDLARFYARMRTAHPHITDITQLKLYVGEKNGLVNNNPARSFENFTGGKHGFTEIAGRTFIGTFRGESGSAEIGLVLLGSRDLKSDITSALEYVKNHPTLSICYNAGTCPVMQEMVSYDNSSR